MACMSKEFELGAGRGPSWAAWIEISAHLHRCAIHIVAVPRGPRGLKSDKDDVKAIFCGRGPSWAAWIEIASVVMSGLSSQCRGPSWAAWIEMLCELGFLA